MSDKTKKSSASIKDSLRVIGRILKDTKPIAHWLLIAAVISLTSILLSMIAPEIIGELSNSIYEFCAEGIEINHGDFTKKLVILAVVFFLSSITGIITEVLIVFGY